MLAVAAVPAVFLLVGVLFLPDSPRWYALRGRLDEAKRVRELSRDRAQAEEDYKVIVAHTERDKSEDRGAALRDLREFRGCAGFCSSAAGWRSRSRRLA